MVVGAVMCPPCTKTMRHIKWCRFDRYRRRQLQVQCTQPQTYLPEETTKGSFSSDMTSCPCKISPIFPVLVLYLVLSSSFCPVYSLETANQTFRPEKELQKLKIIKARLNKINKPSLKTIRV